MKYYARCMRHWPWWYRLVLCYVLSIWAFIINALFCRRAAPMVQLQTRRRWRIGGTTSWIIRWSCACMCRRCPWRLRGSDSDTRRHQEVSSNDCTLEYPHQGSILSRYCRRTWCSSQLGMFTGFPGWNFLSEKKTPTHSISWGRASRMLIGCIFVAINSNQEFRFFSCSWKQLEKASNSVQCCVHLMCRHWPCP